MYLYSNDSNHDEEQLEKLPISLEMSFSKVYYVYLMKRLYCITLE